MSTVYLGTNQEQLAERMALALDEAAQSGDFFTPITVVVPNRYLGKWLRLWLTRRFGVTVNLRFLYLEKVLWELLREQDPDSTTSPPELLDHARYRLMTLSLILDSQACGAVLEPLHHYVNPDGGEPRRDYFRRAWHLADRIARLSRDYQYHRHDSIIKRWRSGEDGYPKASADDQALERCQREIFRRITGRDGLQDRLSQSVGKRLLTLPQYADEVMSRSKPCHAPAARPLVHLFGISQISALHADVLHWLGERYDLRLYHLNPLVARISTSEARRSAVSNVAERFTRDEEIPGDLKTPHERLLASWGRAGAEGLWTVEKLLSSPGGFHSEILPTPPASGNTVLARLQQSLLDQVTESAPRLRQDRSLQIVGCPGIEREVETVYHNILHHLRAQPDLKQTDIAVLVTDMLRYRPVIQSVFDRRPDRLIYNLADFSAAGLSMFGHALLGMLDLALESFTRSRVFAVLLNPCFLERLGVDREQALVWLQWAETLGIYHSWDAEDKKRRGYGDSPLYSWRLGLQRLRLGRLMDPGDDKAAAQAYRGVVPAAELASCDKRLLSAFCRAIDGLLPMLLELRDVRASGERWANDLRLLIETFLAVPSDRPEEEEVRERVLSALPELHLLDHVRCGQAASNGIPLALVREFIAEQLECVEGTHGEYLTGGVTISALQPLRPVPFEIIYVLGLGEGLFPSTDAAARLDLRTRQRCRGDILSSESDRYLLLEALFAARRKLYLLYTNRDLQKDQALYPCGPVLQLQRYLQEDVLNKKFETATVPLSAVDHRYLAPVDDGGHSDVLVNYDDSERLATADAARSANEVLLDTKASAELERRLAIARKGFPILCSSGPARKSVSAVTIRELCRFLRCPAEAAIRRHLHLEDEAESELCDDEPFCTGFPYDYRLMRQTIDWFVKRAIESSVESALAEWRPWFNGLYERWRLCGYAPEGAFGECDRRRFEERLHERIASRAGLGGFLHERAAARFCGPVFVGDNRGSLAARIQFPALTLADEDGVAFASLSGALPLVWGSDDTIESLVIASKKVVSSKEISIPLLEPVLTLLATAAGTERGVDGSCSREWLGERALKVHIAHEGGLATFHYDNGDFEPSEALAYLVRLVRDFLDPTSFDLIPLDLVLDDANLQAAYTSPDAKWTDDRRVAYQQMLAIAIDEDGEKESPTYRAMKLVALVKPDVPPDALDKVSRRFRLPDRGPARNRETERKAR
jgi:exonuclease V gamma subunit